MFINLPDLNNWNNYLKQITPENNRSSDNYLCIISKKYLPPKFQVLTKDEYVNFFKNHSLLDTTCNKLSLNEIYSISEFFLSKKKLLEFRGIIYNLATTQDSLLYYNTNTSHFINKLNISETDENLKTQVEKFIQDIKIIPQCLEKITKRAIYKHQQEKIRGIWGKIKYYIWILFSDTQSHLKWDQENSISAIKKQMFKAIAERLVVNLSSFYENAGLYEESDQLTINVSNHKLNSEYIKQWLVKYVHNQYNFDPRLSETRKKGAKEARSNLITLYKL